MEFFLTMMAQDNIAPRYGIHRLKSHFIWEVDQLNNDQHHENQESDFQHRKTALPALQIRKDVHSPCLQQAV